jgi:S-disulfanyl-L-cysteine oxidoreductase SoxD
MSTSKRATRVLQALAVLAGLTALSCATRAASQEGPGLGRPATAEQIAGWDISIAPDGSGLPPGSGSVQEGARIFAAKCQSCHGAEGAGQPYDRLVGGLGTLKSQAPVRTVGSYWPYATTLFDYIRRAMPLPQPQSLTADETYALAAYLLERNGVIKAGDKMNAKTLPRVVMPNRDSFIQVYKDPPAE